MKPRKAFQFDHVTVEICPKNSKGLKSKKSMGRDKLPPRLSYQVSLLCVLILQSSIIAV